MALFKKIDITYTSKKGSTIYLCSTNWYKTCKEAIGSMKKLKSHPQTLDAYKRLVKEKTGEALNFNHIHANFSH
jgi:hypothetical protein